MISPTRYAVLKQEIDNELDEAIRRKDTSAKQAALAKRTALEAARATPQL